MGLKPIVAERIKRLVAVLTLVVAAQFAVACQDKQGSPDPSPSSAMTVSTGVLCGLAERNVGERTPLEFLVGTMKVSVYATEQQVAAVEIGRGYRFTYETATRELASIEAYGGDVPDPGACG